MERVKIISLKILTAAHCLLILIIPVLFVQGCYILPIPTGEDKVLAGDEVTNEELNFIRPGITTKKEVVERLGEPTVIWEDERIFAYDWQMRWGILLWAHYPSSGVEDIANKYVLLIRFDPNDQVERFEATERSNFDSYGEHLENWLKKIEEPQPPEAKQQSDRN